MLLNCLWNSCRFRKSRSSRARRAFRTNIQACLESLEDRRLLTVLTVDVNDPAAGDPGDNLYAGIQEAVDAAEEGDQIRIEDGTYAPFVVETNNVTIRAARPGAGPVIDATGVDNGVEVRADGITIRGLTVINAGRNGLFITGDANTFINNTARNNGEPGTQNILDSGFAFVDSDNNRLHGNRAENNTRNGFLFLTDSDGNTLLHNIADGNGHVGFVVLAGVNFPFTPEQTSDSTTLIHNTATDNLTGFSIIGGNSFDADGVETIFPAIDTTLTRNVSQGNAVWGFEVFALDDARLTGNRAEDNGDHGFFLSDVTNSTVAANGARNNGHTQSTGSGFFLRDSDDNAFRVNAASGNAQDGFLLVTGSGNTFLANRADGNGRDGFRVEPIAQFGLRPVAGFPPFEAVLFAFSPSDDNTFLANVASDNGDAGFRLIAAGGNTLLANSASGNGGDGFRIEGLELFAPDIFLLTNPGELLGSFQSEGNVLIANTARDNAGWGYALGDPDDLFANLFLHNRSNDNVLGDFDF